MAALAADQDCPSVAKRVRIEKKAPTTDNEQHEPGSQKLAQRTIDKCDIHGAPGTLNQWRNLVSTQRDRRLMEHLDDTLRHWGPAKPGAVPGGEIGLR